MGNNVQYMAHEELIDKASVDFLDSIKNMLNIVAQPLEKSQQMLTLDTALDIFTIASALAVGNNFPEDEMVIAHTKP